MVAYLTYWKLKEKPFEDLRNPRFFFESTDHLEALHRLLYLAQDRNMCCGLLTGEIGSGKTITRTMLKKKLELGLYQIVDFENSNLAFPDLLYEIICRIQFRHPDFTADPMPPAYLRNDRYALFNIFKQKLARLCENENRHLVLTFDEAQQMETTCLEELKNLTNIGAEHTSYLTIIFVGQSELRDILKKIPGLDQRIGLRFHLNNLDLENTGRYIEYRLKTAGHEHGRLFSSSAIQSIFMASGGCPRQINLLCKLSLEHGCLLRIKEIEEKTVADILEEQN